MEFVLASASPRRKELLKKLIENFEIDAATGEERASVALSPAQYAETLAAQKAREVAAKRVHCGKIVLGADTVVAIGGKILGKPKNKENARQMLTLLSGKEHSVVTGVCLIFPCGKHGESEGGEIIAHAETKVKFKAFSEEFIEAYVESGSPMDKAGAYGIQDGLPVEYVKGSIDNVVGLPTELLQELLRS